MMSNEVRKMVDQLYEVIRGEVIEVVQATLRGAKPAAPQQNAPGRAPRARKAKRSKLSNGVKKATSKPAPWVDGSMAAHIVDLVEKTPGIRRQAIADALGVKREALRHTFEALLRAGRIRSEGKTNGQSYFPPR